MVGRINFVKLVDCKLAVKELRITRQVQDEMSQRQREWNEIDGERHVLISTDKVKRIERNSHLFVMRMLTTLNYLCECGL